MESGFSVIRKRVVCLMFMFNLTGIYSLIRVRGANRIDFLHRMSTGDLLGIQPGTGRTTVFTTPIGRMVDYATVLAFPDSLLMVSGGNGQSKLVRWLRKYVFFNDDVQLADESASSSIIGVFGEGASGFVERITPGASRLTLHGHISSVDSVIVGVPPLGGSGYFVINPPPEMTQGQPVDSIASYQDQRIAAGYPMFPYEINEDYIPLEAGLLQAVSFRKGCYIGQEIIARMESRGQLAKRLVRFEAEQAIGSGAELKVEGVPAGKVTSASTDGRSALGYLRSQYVSAGQHLLAGDTRVAVVTPI
jgi:folate-binding protein YgfZ